MIKFLKFLVSIVAIFAGIATIIGFYTQYTSHNPIIEIKSVTTDKLTDLPNVDGLKAHFLFKDSTVNSLWKLNYIISNSGNEVIIGEGNKKNIIKDSLTFQLPENFKILDFYISNSGFPFEKNYTKNKIRLKFMQWKPNENFDLAIYAEQLNNSKGPLLTTDDREIIGGTVNYTTLQKVKEEIKPLFLYLPKFLQPIFWWFGFISFGLVIIVIPIIWIVELIKNVKFNRWFKNYSALYNDWMNKLVELKKIQSSVTPKSLPKHLWSEYPYSKPVIPDNAFGSMTLGFIIVFIYTLIPLLLLIKI